MRDMRTTSGTRLVWHKSSHSDSEGAQCVEVAWRKSSYSDSEGAECVEVAEATAAVHIRDSKDPEGPILTVPRGGWADFLRYAAER
jgi:hypothetical protein